MADWDVTTTGNEITDTQRARGSDGDGRPVEGSIGIWEATTNIWMNGGCETNQSGYGVRAGGTGLRVVTPQSKFGKACCQVTTTGSGTSDGVSIGGGLNGAPCSPSTTYTFSCWVKNSSGSGSIQVVGQWYTAAGAYIGGSLAGSTAVHGEWVRITATGTTSVDAAFVGMEVYHNVASPAVFFVDGVQIEQQPIATPYVETNGASASRGLSGISAPVSYIDETTMWIALRLRMGFSYNNPPHSNTYPTLFDWRDSGTAVLYFGFDPTAQQWYIQRQNSATPGTLNSAAQTFPAGTIMTLIGAFTATTIGISVNGGAFATVGNTAIPTLSATSFKIGDTIAGGLPIDSDVFWFACGTGTLSNADAATIAALPSTGRALSDFPGAPTLLYTQADPYYGSRTVARPTYNIR